MCRFSLKIFAETCFCVAFKEQIYCIFGLLQLQLYLQSSTLSSILADLRSVSRNSPSLKIHEKEILSSLREFWCLGNIWYRSYTNLSNSLELSRSGCSTLRCFFAILTSFWQIKLDMWQPSGLVDVLIKCCCYNFSAT